MAHRTGREVGGSPPDERLTDMSVDVPAAVGDEEPQTTADAESGAGADDDSGCAGDPQLRRIESQPESLKGVHRLAVVRHTVGIALEPGAFQGRNPPLGGGPPGAPEQGVRRDRLADYAARRRRAATVS